MFDKNTWNLLKYANKGLALNRIITVRSEYLKPFKSADKGLELNRNY